MFLVPDEGSDGVVELHDALYTGPLKKELRADIPYAPHMTVGNSKDRRICEDLVKKLNAEPFEIAAEIKSADVIRIEEDSLKTVSSIKLERR